MKTPRVFFSLLFCISAATFCAAQSATTGAIAGVVSDPSGAVIPKADVELQNASTNAAEKQSTNGAGQFVFPNLQPGTYRITVKAAGFRTASISNLTLAVDKTLNAPVNLEVGASNQTVEVTASSVAVLQTADAQIGNTVNTDSILRLPTLQRNATELMNLQPGVVAGGANLNMRVAGAIDDQNLVTLDGLDITQQVVAGNTAVPTPADSVQEFNVTVLNPNADLTRASGGQISLIGRRGGNQFHVALYEYLQNSDLNSNTWEGNRAGAAVAPIRDNRFGGRIGGPIKKDKTFFFANYEGRRFANVAQLTRTVPTDSLKAGILTFGTQTFDLKSAAVCGTSSAGVPLNLPCDPRGLGISPSVKAQWALMPRPNQFGNVGDGVNTAGYFFNLPVPRHDDYGVLRLDHNFTDKISFNGSYTYFRSIVTGSGDVGILNGSPQSFVQNPQRGSVYSAAINWQIAPTLLNTFRFGYVRDNNAAQATSPTAAAGLLNIPGSNTPAGPIALLIGSGAGFIDSPIDMDTQRARYQANYNGDFQWQDNLTKIWGHHTMQFGGQINFLPYTHVRADKVVGSVASLVATVDGNQSANLTIPNVNTPPTCSGSITTNCITSANATNWARFYASTLGMVDNLNVLAVRDANLQPLPLGTFIIDHTTEYAPYFYAQDVWRLKKSLTLTLGLSYGWQSAPTEKQNLQTVMINATDGSLINGPDFLKARLTAALAGQNYNPNIGFATVGSAKVPVYNPDYGDIAPRVSFAWSPSKSQGALGKLFGEQKSVLRGGFAMVYDRSNTVQSVEIPMLGVGFDQNIIVQGPLCNATGPGGAGCNASTGSNAANPGFSSFRVGVDGVLPTPKPSAATSPVIPPPGYTETLSFQVDPQTHVGRSYNVDLSFQRELPGKITLEVAFLGRYSRRLPQAVNLTSAPYMMVDSASNQTFAQAYDTVANLLRVGTKLANIPSQPFFENQFPGVAAANRSSGSATAFIAGGNSASFANGNVGTLFQNLAFYRRSIGLVPLSNDQAGVEFMRTYIGQSNYTAGILSLQKRFSHGLQLSANFTYGSNLDDNLSNQNNAGFYANSFHPGVDYGPDNGYDRRRVFNMFYTYDLPFGKGRRFSTGNFVDKIIGGWYTSGIVVGLSGLPLNVSEGSNVWGGGTAIIGATTVMDRTNIVPYATINTNRGQAGCVTPYGTANVGTAAATGAGLNIFGDPCAAYASFRYVQLSSDTRTARANPLRGFAVNNMDMSLGKDTAITERVRFKLSVDMFNVFNFHNFNTPGLSYTNPTGFGVISSTFTPANRTNAARWIEIGARIEF